MSGIDYVKRVWASVLHVLDRQAAFGQSSYEESLTFLLEKLQAQEADLHEIADYEAAADAAEQLVSNLLAQYDHLLGDDLREEAQQRLFEEAMDGWAEYRGHL